MEHSDEVKGRLHLWFSAIRDTIRLLELAERSLAACEQDNIVQEDKDHSTKLSEHLKAQPGYGEVPTKLSDIMAFNQSVVRPFPTPMECYAIKDACIGLAITLFCQIRSIGNGAEGKASKNTVDFQNQHFEAILKIAFENDDDRVRFESLCKELLIARNKMIGHADALAFNIQHSDQISSHWGFQKAWENVDISYWLSSCESLAKALQGYLHSGTSN